VVFFFVSFCFPFFFFLLLALVFLVLAFLPAPLSPPAVSFALEASELSYQGPWPGGRTSAAAHGSEGLGTSAGAGRHGVLVAADASVAARGRAMALPAA